MRTLSLHPLLHGAGRVNLRSAHTHTHKTSQNHSTTKQHEPRAGMAPPNTRQQLLALVIIIASLEETLLQTFYRTALRQQSRAYHLARFITQNPPNSPVTASALVRLQRASDAARRAIRQHNHLYRLRRLLGPFPEFLPHHHRLLPPDHPVIRISRGAPQHW